MRIGPWTAVDGEGSHSPATITRPASPQKSRKWQLSDVPKGDFVLFLERNLERSRQAGFSTQTSQARRTYQSRSEERGRSAQPQPADHDLDSAIVGVRVRIPVRAAGRRVPELPQPVRGRRRRRSASSSETRLITSACRGDSRSTETASSSESISPPEPSAVWRTIQDLNPRPAKSFFVWREIFECGHGNVHPANVIAFSGRAKPGPLQRGVRQQLAS